MAKLTGWMRWAACVVLVAALASLAACSRAPAGQPGGASGGQAPQEPAKKPRIGLVFDVGGRGDKSFNDMAYAGLERAQRELGVEVKYLEPAAGGENREELLRLLAQEGYELIFGVGFLFTDHIAKVSKEFPGTKFGLIDGYIPDLTEQSNVVSLLFKEHEGSFLVGAAAGLLTKANKVGFIGGMKIPLIEKFEVGYTAGVKFVNPQAEVLVDYIGTTGEAFKDPVKGKELALAQYQKGADIIYHAAGASGEGLFQAAAETGKLAIGVDADQSLTVTDDRQRKQIVTSMLKRVDVAVYETIKAYVEGAFKGGYRVFGLAEDGVGYALNDYNRSYIEPIKPRLEELKAKIVKGELVVPSTKDELQQFLQQHVK